ncbi:MAG: hypothetical protein O3C34_21235 [Proteobacteria bacterium]|nr:hypothetical protein [Pseudomonadota bacterium]
MSCKNRANYREFGDFNGLALTLTRPINQTVKHTGTFQAIPGICRKSVKSTDTRLLSQAPAWNLPLLESQGLPMGIQLLGHPLIKLMQKDRRQIRHPRTQVRFTPMATGVRFKFQ